MSPGAWGGALLAASLTLGGCGSPPPPAFVREQEQASRARHAGDHLSAARHHERAAELARSPRDAAEQRYLAAQSFARGGDVGRAEALLGALARQEPPAEPSARADFELAKLMLARGDEPGAQAHLAGAIRRHPSSALARRALSEHLAYLRLTAGSAAALAYLEQERARLGASELGETLDYLRARELEQAGQLPAARDAYLSCAARFPYPGGVYWDDALLRAARAELALGAPRAALRHLARLLAEQESASVTGSYERARYAEGQLLIARIHRDQLHDPARARREFRRVWERHRTSTLVDDALFEEALVARSQDDEAGACEPLRIITTSLPESRYAACAPELCRRLQAPPGQACHGYLRRAAGLE